MVTYNDMIRPDTARIYDLLRSGSESECRGVLDSVLDGTGFRRMKSVIIKLYVYMDIFITAKSFSGEIGISDEQFTERFGTVDEIGAKLSSTENMIDLLYDILHQCIVWRADIVRGSGGGAMKAAIDYIVGNYMNCDISLSTVADAAGLSPSYLSMLFKKETGQSFSEHLTNIRINKAKELLGCTSKMVYEVAYDVGFRDYRYFSQIFKKHTGMTPRSFQYSVNVCAEKKIS